jgi:microcystin degradation protein MlrC
MRLAAAAIWHETLSFAHTRTELDSFKAFQLTEGASVADLNRKVANEMGGFLAAAAELGADLETLIFAGALPSPTVSAEAYSHIRERLLTRLQAALPVDGILLALHGAMVAEGVDDVEADLVGCVRAIAGRGVPIVCTLDLHANVSEELFRVTGALIAYDTYPHVDIYERGVEAVHVIRRLVRGEEVASAFRKLPLLTAPQSQSTSDEPLRSVMGRVHEWERDPRVLSISLCPGYPYSDVARLGFAIAVYTRGDQLLAESIADDIAATIWARRGEFAVSNLSAREAVQDATASPETPVILVDAADNIGGGTPGDGTVLLAELLRQDAQEAVVTIADAEAVRACLDAGVGAPVRLRVGGKYDQHHGDPVDVEGYVRLLSDGVYHHTGSYMTGLRVEMGRTAVVRARGVEIVVMENKALPFDAQQLLSLGIQPERQRIIVVKSAIAWKTAYGAIARRVITVDTPGLCTSSLSTIPYARRPQPIFPLDEIG